MKNKNCPHCKQTKPISDFSKRSDSKLGLMSWCRPCNRNKVKKWRLNNKEKCYANMLKWKRKNKVKVSAIQKRYRSNNPLNVRSTKMVCEARSKSLIKNLPFNIDFQYVYNLCKTGKCDITGIEFNTKSGKNPYSPSLDRIVPKLGYIRGNVRVILWALNAFKNKWSDSEIYPIAKQFCKSYEERLTNPADGAQRDSATGVLSVSTT
jgi:hypothetical protein